MWERNNRLVQRKRKAHSPLPAPILSPVKEPGTAGTGNAVNARLVRFRPFQNIRNHGQDGLAVRQLIIHGKFRNQLISLHKSGTGSLPVVSIPKIFILSPPV